MPEKKGPLTHRYLREQQLKRTKAGYLFTLSIAGASRDQILNALDDLLDDDSLHKNNLIEQSHITADVTWTAIKSSGDPVLPEHLIKSRAVK